MLSIPMSNGWQRLKVVDIHLVNGIESCTDGKQTLDDTSFFLRHHSWG